jgi:tricorn protease-like protein
VLADWSRDGRFVVVERVQSRAHLWVARLDGDKVLRPYLDSPYNETQAQLSPDGRWIAYTSNESGHDEVYVQSFPVPGRKRQLSTAGGAMPRWRADGKELFFLARNQHITAVPVTDSASLTLGAPKTLFRTRLVVEGSESIGLPTRYDVSPEGERFLVRYPTSDPGAPITVVINWRAALRP